MTQHRQAVAVQDPAALARFLELLIGTAGGCWDWGQRQIGWGPCELAAQPVPAWRTAC